MSNETEAVAAETSMTEAEYRAYPALNYSTLKHMRKSPAHYKQVLEHGSPHLSSYDFGTAVHTVVLEPFAVEERFFVPEVKIDRRTKEGKALAEQAGTRTIMNPDEWERVLLCAKEVTLSPTVAALLQHERTKVEEPILFRFPGFPNLPCKAKPDIMHYSEEHGLVIVDLKTFHTSDPGAVCREGAKYGWHLQAQFYLAAARQYFGLPEDFPGRAMVIAVETEAPHTSCLVEWGEKTATAARVQLAALLMAVERCEASGLWPGRPCDPVVIDAPDYLLFPATY